MTVRLDDQVAIVTGASAGIGRAITRAFVERGAKVAGMARRPEPGAELEAELGPAFRFVPGDVTEPAACRRLVEATVDAFGRADVLVNNAGYGLPVNRVEDTTDEDWRAMLDANLTSCFNMCRAVLPTMQAQAKGLIVNLSSFAGEQALAYMAPYAAAKAGLVQLTKVVAVENRDRGVRANAVIIGAVPTKQSHDTAREVAKFLRGPEFVPDREKPIGSFAGVRMSAESVARTIAALCCDDASELTGATIALDRGFSAGWLSSTLLELVAGQAVDWP
jgi:NAD(P)-dependent dehydrogenase (short-subunit alcohol dehydrogenase family)